MAYTLTLGYLHVIPAEALSLEDECTCEEARHGCSPPYVFSVTGQVDFRTALHHLRNCRKQACRSLRVRVVQGMLVKLRWLLQEEILLGCVQVQPYLYGTRRITFHREHFPLVAHHLASCPKESCAQLRRALLLSIREKVRPMPVIAEAAV